MKRGEIFLNAFENIDDKFILETENVDFKKEKRKIVYLFKKENLTKLVSVAACLVLFITGGVMLNKRTQNPMKNSELVQIANPITEVDSFEELQKYFNVNIPLLDKDVDSYIAIGFDGYADHARIKYLDDTTFDLDLSGKDDASGIYGGVVTKEEKINGINVKFYTYENINYAIWQKDEIAYSYSIKNTEIDLNELNELLQIK